MTAESLWLMESMRMDVSVLVPAQYAAYRPVVADAMLFFVQHLPPARLTAIIAEQEDLPRETGVERRLAAMMCHCPTLHKLGQVVARDRRLAPELRRRLQALESMEPMTPLSAIQPIVDRELGSSPASAIELAPRAIAEASVAVVFPFSVPGAPQASRAGVLKILKPGVEDILQEELEIWSLLGTYIDERCEHHGAPTLRYADTLQTIRELLSNEIKLDREQNHLALAAHFFESADQVHIPSLLPFCTSRITAMERIYGRKVTETTHLPDQARRRLANLIIEALIARSVWAANASSIFHADPHAGNLFYTDEGRLAILDWSLVGHLGKHERIQIMQVMLGALTFDEQRIAQGIHDLARTPPNQVELREVARAAVNRLLPAKLPGFRWLMSLMDAAALSAGVQFGEDLLMFRKSVLTIEGLVVDVSADSSFDRVIPASAVRQFSREWSSRALASPSSRHFGTHISNLDLLGLYWGVPLTTTRYWKHVWSRWLSGDSR